MPDVSKLDHLNLPVPDVERGRLVSKKNACVYNPTDLMLRSLCGSLHGINRTAEALGIDRSMIDCWLAGKYPIGLAYLDRLAALARQQSAYLAALAVRLETVDRPVLEERRRIVNERRREMFRDRIGYYPEENQVMKRQRPPA